jgi:hypothetical protein
MSLLHHATQAAVASLKLAAFSFQVGAAQHLLFVLHHMSDVGSSSSCCAHAIMGG